MFDKFKGIIEHMKDLYAFHAVVGYFRSSVRPTFQPGWICRLAPSMRVLTPRARRRLRNWITAAGTRKWGGK